MINRTIGNILCKVFGHKYKELFQFNDNYTCDKISKQVCVFCGELKHINLSHTTENTK